MNTTDALVIGCLILDTKSFILPMHNFARIFFQIHAEFIFCLVLRQAMDLSQPKFTNIKGSFVIRVDCISTADSCSAQFLAANKII